MSPESEIGIKHKGTKSRRMKRIPDDEKHRTGEDLGFR
jgi:hypothetical protein